MVEGLSRQLLLRILMDRCRQRRVRNLDGGDSDWFCGASGRDMRLLKEGFDFSRDCGPPIFFNRLASVVAHCVGRLAV
jgi:hypothetical protein